jgi:hypothetical protein
MASPRKAARPTFAGAAAGLGAGCGGAAAAGLGAAAAAAAGAAAAAPSSTVAMPWPITTVSPSLTSSALMVPGAVAVYLTSMVTLSVSICAITSSSLTASPTGQSNGTDRRRCRGDRRRVCAAGVGPGHRAAPGCFSRVAMEPSDTESPMGGHTMFTALSHEELCRLLHCSSWLVATLRGGGVSDRHGAAARHQFR